jgi:hypothetical protein
MIESKISFATAIATQIREKKLYSIFVRKRTKAHMALGKPTEQAGPNDEVRPPVTQRAARHRGVCHCQIGIAPEEVIADCFNLHGRDRTDCAVAAQIRPASGEDGSA